MSCQTGQSKLIRFKTSRLQGVFFAFLKGGEIGAQSQRQILTASPNIYLCFGHNNTIPNLTGVIICPTLKRCYVPVMQAALREYDTSGRRLL